MRNFEENYNEMGLTQLGTGCYFYSDQYSQVAYVKIKTNTDFEILNGKDIQHLAVFTRKTDNDDFKYRTQISMIYQFIGNDTINQQLRNSINEVGTPILREICQQNTELTSMLNQVIISHEKNIPQQGDIYPSIIVENTYNGTGAANLSFGLCMKNFGFGDDTMYGFRFKEKIVSMRQIHLARSQTRLSTTIGGYISVFSDNIVDLVRHNFELELNETEMLSTLNLIENISKRKREGVSSLLSELNPDESQPITAWKLFLAIARFSSLEKNLNAKRILENIAERVLVIPERMMNAMERINRNGGNNGTNSNQ